MSMIGSLAAFDHWRQRVTLIESVPVLGLDDGRHRRRLRRRGRRASSGPSADLGPAAAVRRRSSRRRPDEALPDVKSSMPDGLYQQAVEVAKEHIVAGDIFQVVLAQRYDLELDADPFDVYRVLRQVNPSPYMYFVRHPELTIVGLVARADGAAARRPGHLPADRRHPQAGRAPTSTTGGMAAELTEHPKERAEHVMLVDLARNDVGRVAEFGTMHDRRADDAGALQPRDAPDVAGARATLREGLGPIDVLRATLPAGTVSGAPKVRAMEIIDDLEPVKRGPYAGVVGYVDWSGNLDTAIAIRTMFCAPDRHQPAGRRRHRRRLGPRRRGPRVPQQGGRPAGRHPRRPPDDRRPPRRRHPGVDPLLRSPAPAEPGSTGAGVGHPRRSAPWA